MAEKKSSSFDAEDFGLMRTDPLWVGSVSYLTEMGHLTSRQFPLPTGEVAIVSVRITERGLRALSKI